MATCIAADWWAPHRLDQEGHETAAIEHRDRERFSRPIAVEMIPIRMMEVGRPCEAVSPRSGAMPSGLADCPPRSSRRDRRMPRSDWLITS